jgi:hypothetical protein
VAVVSKLACRTREPLRSSPVATSKTLVASIISSTHSFRHGADGDRLKQADSGCDLVIEHDHDLIVSEPKVLCFKGDHRTNCICGRPGDKPN